MYRIRLIYDVPGWAYWRRCQGIERHYPVNFDVHVGRGFPTIDENGWHPDGYDLILNLMPDQSALRTVLEMRGENPIIVGGLNVGYGHHAERLRMCENGADHIVVNNRDCWERLGKPDGMTWISNGVDREIFHVKVPIEERTPKVLWCGSKYHCHYTNIKGWREVLLPLGEKLKAAGIDYDWRLVESDRPETCFTTQQMVDWYNTGTVYICASSSEGTPNPALEAAACGCTLVSTPVGNMPELIRHGQNGAVTQRSAAMLLLWINGAIDIDGRSWPYQMQRDIAAWDWRDRAGLYYGLFERLIQDRRAGRLESSERA